jgi:hypothetical protein
MTRARNRIELGYQVLPLSEIVRDLGKGAAVAACLIGGPYLIGGAVVRADPDGIWKEAVRLRRGGSSATFLFGESLQ